MRGLRVLLGLGAPFFSLVLAAQWDPALLRLVVRPCASAARRGRALIGEGPPPFFSPLAASQVNRAGLFGGSPHPGWGVLPPTLLHAVRWERPLFGG